MLWKCYAFETYDKTYKKNMLWSKLWLLKILIFEMFFFDKWKSGLFNYLKINYFKF